jgi:hypothetical protein
MNSEARGALAKALATAQSQIKGATKDATNPHFKNKYADLSSVWDACRKPLSENGLSILQYTVIHEGQPALVTMLLHVSGESVEGLTPLLVGKQDMQALGSAITYARRYGLAAMVGVAPEDDDGQAAVATNGGRTTQQELANAMQKPVGYDEWRMDFESAADNGRTALGDAWLKAKPEYRGYYNATVSNEQRDKLRAKADAAGVPA